MQRPRTPSRISESLHRQLNSYALAAGAAGVSLMAVAQPAEAKIVYRHAHVVIGGDQSYNLDLNHDGITDFAIHNYSGKGSCSGHPWRDDGLIPVPAIKGNGVIAPFSSFASALYRGAEIGHSRIFHSSRNPMAGVVSGYVPFQGKCIHLHRESGPWLNVSNRYLGLKFILHGKTHYGWARLSVQAGYVYVNATLTGYAYETIANKPIIAGKTKGPDVITIAPASLGHLARRASAIPAWRRKQQ